MSYKKYFIYPLKYITVLLLTFSLVFSNIGCVPFRGNNDHKEESTEYKYIIFDNKEDNAAFAEFVKKLFIESVTSDTVSLHSYLQNPEKLGITDYDITLGRYDIDNLDSTKELTEYLTTLSSFDRNTLSDKQKITYDQLYMYLNNQLEFSDLSMFDTCLSPTIGLQVQLPIIFSEYAFNENKDVTEYLEILKDTDAFFTNIVEYETLRSQKGYFMEDEYADSIVKQCQEFVDSADDGCLISTFDERINKLSTLSDEEKNAYKAQNSTIVKEHVIKGYQILIDGLKKLKGTNKYKGGLCNYPTGKKYYEYLLDNHCGWSKTVDEYNALLDKYIAQNMLEMQSIMLKDSSVLDNTKNFKFRVTDPDGILDDLKKKIINDFPKGPEINYSIKEIAKSLQDYASPAMYFTPQIDNLANNSIYINPSSPNASDLYTTMAHEGYPGHMYQITYFINSNPDLIRLLIEPGGYVEGWATYVELMSYRYGDTCLGSNSASTASLMAANQAVILCLYAKVDIGVNYYGWKLTDVSKYLCNYGFDDESVAKEIYDAMVTEPGNYCQYVLGYIGFCELKQAAMNKYGDNFNLKEFHKFVLDVGPVQFDLLFKYLADGSLSADSISAAAVAD